VIKGRVFPALEGFQVVSVVVGDVTVSAYADEFGVFQLNGILQEHTMLR
jgi:hypothetical protein